MKYSYTYSGSQAAFVFSGLAVFANGIPTMVDEAIHIQLTENKFAKHLIESGELDIQEVSEPGDLSTKSKTGGRGGKVGGGKAATDAAKAADDAALATVKAELTELEVTFSEDETLEQLQAKLNQAKE